MPPDSLDQVNQTTSLPGGDLTIETIINFVMGLPDAGLYIAATAGLLIYVIGWFGGTKNTLNKIVFIVIMISIIGFFGLRIPAFLLTFLLSVLPVPLVAVFVVYTLYTAFLLGMAISLYETWIVTQDEIRPDLG